MKEKEQVKWVGYLFPTPLVQRYPMRHLFLFALLLSCIQTPSSLFAQDNEEPDRPYDTYNRAFLNIIPEIEIGFTIGDFHNKMDRDFIVGTGISIFYRLKNKPIDFGIRIGDLTYDKVVRRFDDADGIRLVNKTKNKIWNSYAAFRYEPNTKTGIQPYFEGSFGFTRFYTKTYFKEAGINLGDDESNPRFDRSTLNSDWGITYGGAVGFYYRFDKTYHSCIDVQVGYRTGGLGKFLIKNDSIGIQAEPIDNFLERRSNLRLISFKIGISVFGFTT